MGRQDAGITTRSLRISMSFVAETLGTDPDDVLGMLERAGAGRAGIARLRAAWAENPWAGSPPDDDENDLDEADAGRAMAPPAARREEGIGVVRADGTNTRWEK